MKAVLNSVAILGLVLGFAVTSYAQGDSSSDAAGGFARQVEDSEAVVIRVPVNARGEELTQAAEMRIYEGEDVGTAAALKSAFDTATDAGRQPEVTQADLDRDSSTSGWNHWRQNGWRSNYYYNYQPSYYYSGYQYRYQYARQYDYWSGNSGYRYYYYNRCW